jgi:hypothetical protein
MYALVRENGHVVWKEQWCALTLGVSFGANFYMTQEDQIFIVHVVVTKPTREMDHFIMECACLYHDRQLRGVSLFFCIQSFHVEWQY